MTSHDRPADVRAEAVREERLRLSRELHDGIGQDLVSLGYLIDGIAGDDPATLDASVRAAREHVTRVSQNLRRAIDGLRTDIDGPALGPALLAFARQTSVRCDLNLRLDDRSPPRRLTSDVENHLAWIGREAISNVGRHAAARSLWVSVVVAPPAARVVVADDGCGIDAGRRDASGGHGLRMMTERAALIGASVDVTDRPGGGTVVTVSTGEGTP